MGVAASSSFRLLSLPVEIVENVVSYLPPQGMLRLRALNRGMRDLIDASPAIQYRLELFAASLEDGLRKPSVTVADRRALLERYRSRWDKLRGDEWKRVALPAHTKRVLEGGVLGCIAESIDDKLDVHFIQLPSASREVRLKQWAVRGLPKCDATLNINPEADLLVAPEVINEGRTFRVYVLRLSDGFPHALTSTDSAVHYVDYESKKVLSSLRILASGHRLVVKATFDGTSCFGYPCHNTLLVWDWRSGARVLKTSRCWVDQVQFLDDYRIIGITRPEEQSRERSLVLWDTTTAKERQLTFEIPSGGINHQPKYLVEHSWVPVDVGSHRSDPARRAVGIQCLGHRVKAGKDDDYMIVVNVGDVCAYASRKGNFSTKIPWKTWGRSTRVIKTSRSATKTTFISGCLLFAMMKGLSGWNFIELLRVYDFSPGTRGGRYPDRPAVRDVLLNLGRGTVGDGDNLWCFTDDNLLLFHTPSPNGRVTLLLWTL